MKNTIFNSENLTEDVLAFAHIGKAKINGTVLTIIDTNTLNTSYLDEIYELEQQSCQTVKLNKKSYQQS